jgi:predicted transcriptional regulator
MSDDTFFSSMYGGNLYHDKTTKPVTPAAVSRDKLASRVIGGMKAQNSHTKTVEIDGELHTFPKAEYVSQLETQLREARNKIRDLETKQGRLIKANNRIMDKIRQIEQDLANKIDIR